MPLPGGPAAKVGNRYETKWTLSEVLGLLSGETESIRLEDPNVEKAEFVVTKGSHQEFHQVKRSHPSGKWSLATLDSYGLLQAIGKALRGNQNRFVFASICAAQELLELCEAAMDAESIEEFNERFLKAQTRATPFKSLLRYWQCDRETAVDYLRRIVVRTIGERDLEDLIRWKVSTLFLADPNQVTATLWSVVENSTQQTLTRQDLVASLATAGYWLRQTPDARSAAIAVRRTTDAYRDGERRRLIRGKLVPRGAVEALLSGLEEHEEPADGVLTGKAGAGKTACVVQFVEAVRERGMPVLAFRFDRHLSVSSTSELGIRLQLEESPVLVLAAAAERAGLPGVLVIDQVDVASTVSGRQSEAIDLIGSLLEEARGTRSRALIHTIVACRTFDWNHDHRLRKLMPGSSTQVDVREFEIAEVRTILEASGFNPASFGTRQLQLLCLPQNLYLFLESGSDASQSPTFSTVKEIFDLYWDEKRQSVAGRVTAGTDAWTSVVQILCDEMTATQQLLVQRERLDEIPIDYVNQMASEGVLVVDGRSYGFGHESFFDYCFARLYANRPESLVSLLVRSEQHLFRRAQIRQVLTYLRDSSRNRYFSELRDLLSDERVRPHIKDLAFGLLAEVTDPTQDEWGIWNDWIQPYLRGIEQGVPNSDTLAGLAWHRLLKSRSWFLFLEQSGVIKGWMESSNDRLVYLALNYLRFHQSHLPDRVAALVGRYVDLGGQWESRIQHVIEFGPFHRSRPLFEYFLRLLENGRFDQGPSQLGAAYTFWTRLHRLASERPDWCSEAIGRWFRRRLAIARAIGEDLRNQEFLGFDRQAEELLRKCSSGAPAEFVRQLLPVVLEISDFAQVPGEPPKRDFVWKWIRDPKDPTVELACLLALADALAELATDGVEDLRKVIADLRNRETYVANFLLLALYGGGSEHCADEAISLLCREPWRFECGTIDSQNWYAMEVIRRAISHCTDKSSKMIQARILGYVRPYERTPTGYSYHGSGRFALLSVIPERLRSTHVKRHFAELERKFGEPPGPPKSVEGAFLESPIPESATQRMTDSQWLRAIETYRSELSPQSLRGEHTGGALELARSLEERTKEAPVRFAELSLRFPSEAHPVYTEKALAGLRNSEISSELKLRVVKKAFEESRGACGMAITDVLGNIRDRLPDDAVQMLHILATDGEDPSERPLRHVASGKNPNTDTDIDFVGINSIRGRAAEAIQRLILTDRDYIDRFNATLQIMIKDPSVAVSSCIVGTLRAVAYHDPNRGIELFQRMDLSDDGLLSTTNVQSFIFERLHDSFEALRPLVERLLRSAEPSTCQAGARFAGIASFLHETATDLADEALHSGDKHRLGIAEVAAANIANPQRRAWCEERLRTLFNDSDPDVRAHAGLCFQNLSTEPLERYEHLILSYCDSMAYKDDPFLLLRALEESRERLPGITCVVCEKFLDGLARDRHNARDRYSWQIGTVAKLVFRTYQQYLNDTEWACRSLNLIDRISLESAGSAEAELEEFER